MRLSEADVLLVDDEPEIQEIFGMWLRKIGCGVVRTATDGKDALDALNSAAADLIITDVRMPRMDGPEFVRSLTALGHVPPIIMLSGFGELDVREMYALGVEAFLPKPTDLKDLRRAVERALGPRTDLWLTALENAPRQIVIISPESMKKSSTGEDHVRLGRGGFSVHYAAPLMRGTVSFECSFPTEQRKLKGQGYVRWISREDQAAGIEFAFLDPSCREGVLKEINAIQSQDFIPSLLGCYSNFP